MKRYDRNSTVNVDVRQAYREATSAADVWGIADTLRASGIVAADPFHIVGTSGNDHLVGTALGEEFDMSQGGDDYVDGGDGSDTIRYDAGFDAGDRVIGGTGEFDTLWLLDSAPLTITGSMVTGIEQFLFQPQTDELKKITFAPDVKNESGYITISTGGLGQNYQISAANSPYSFIFQASNGFCTFLGGNAGDTFRANENGISIFDGAAGHNRVSFEYVTNTGVKIDLSLTTVQGWQGGSVQLANIDDVKGTRSADTIKANDHDNLIQGLGGNDVIQGLGGNDLVMIGGPTSFDVPTHGYIDGGTGFDLIALDYQAFVGGGMTVNLNNRGYQDTGLGTIRLLGIEGVSATKFADAIAGGDQKNTLYGSGGSDVLNGQGGADILFGDSYVQIVNRFGSDDPYRVSMSDTPGDDFLKGGSGNDILYGEGGDDILAGGLGADKLYGGYGADVFLYTDPGESRGHGVDTIRDFEVGDRYEPGDRIDVSLIDPDTATPGDQAFHLGRTAGHTGDILVAFDATQNVTNVTFYVDGDARPDLLVKLAGEVALDASSFVF